MKNHEQPRTESKEPRNFPPPIATETVRAETKKFFLDLNENDRGMYLRIKESSGGGRFNFVMVPGEALEDFLESLEIIVAAYNGRL